MSQTFGPYSPIRQAGDFYYISGQVGVDPETNMCGQTIEEQTAQIMANLESLLATMGLGMNDIVKTTIYVKDMADFAKVNDVYAGYFEPPFPARATIGAKDLPHVGGEANIKIEIDAVAYKGK